MKFEEVYWNETHSFVEWSVRRVFVMIILTYNSFIYIKFYVIFKTNQITSNFKVQFTKHSTILAKASLSMLSLLLQI